MDRDRNVSLGRPARGLVNAVAESLVQVPERDMNSAIGIPALIDVGIDQPPVVQIDVDEVVVMEPSRSEDLADLFAVGVQILVLERERERLQLDLI